MAKEPGPDERPAAEQEPVRQELDSLLYHLPMRLEGGVRGHLHLRWTEAGIVSARLAGPAVRLLNRIRDSRDED